MRIAVIGAGMAGLTLAHKLGTHSQVSLFEKSRGVGGRIASRRAEPYSFDHGAQFFKIDSQEFADFMSPLIEKGIIQSWKGRFAEFVGQNIINTRVWDEGLPHYVGVPSMNAIAKYLAQDLDIKLHTQIERIELDTEHEEEKKWLLLDNQQQSYGPFDWIISTAPAAQSLTLLPECFAHYSILKDVSMQA